MVFESRRVAVSVLDQSSFKSLDMNMAVDPSAHVLVSLNDWRACELPEGEDFPEREGGCYLGVDLGGSASMTAAVAYFPDTGRFETWAAFPSEPGLADRGKADGAGGLYQAAFEAGTLQLHPGRTVNAGRFYGEVIDALKGSDIKAIGSDRFRRAESEQAYADAELTVPAVWRGTGASATADGSADVRSFQAAVLERTIVARPDGLLRLALSESECTYDDRGNPAIDKKSEAGAYRPSTGRGDCRGPGAAQQAPEASREVFCDGSEIMAGLRGRDIYRDRRWEPARLLCFARFGHRCARCHRPGLIECHHKVKLAGRGRAVRTEQFRTALQNVSF